MRITGSRVHRVWKCPASAVLRQFSDDYPAAEPARGRGKAIHAFLQRVGTVERARLLADAPPELVPLLEALDLENLPVGLATEVSYAWNWRERTARELGRDLPLHPEGGVDYDHPSIVPPVDWDSEIPCTLDVVGVAQAHDGERYGTLAIRRGYVGDYKSGHSKYPPPDMFGQTLLGACCVAHVYGCDDVAVELIHIHNNGSHHTVRRIVNTWWDLGDFADQLRDAMGRMLTAQIDGELTPYEREHLVREGPWCEHCPAYRGCPAKLALVRELPQELAQVGVGQDLTLDPQALTVSNAAGAWMAIERIEDVLAEAKKELCKLAWHESIPLPDGRVLGRLETSKRAVNGKVAAELLERRYGAAERNLRVEVSVTLAALRQAAVAHLQKGEKLETRNKTGVYDRLLEELEREGGIETKITDAVRPHVPKRK